MNLTILCALFSLAFADTLPEVTLSQHEGPLALSQPFDPPALIEHGLIDEEFLPKGTISLFLATDGDDITGGGGLFFPTDAEPLDEADFSVDGLGAKVRSLLRREIKAGQLLFGEPQRSELQARGALLIEWLDQGKFPAPDQVDELEARVNELEERVTDHLARDFRISVYNTYHTDRKEFNHRRARWKLIDERWREFEQTAQRRAHLNQWLAEAIEVSQPGSTTPLPPAPAWYYEPAEGLAQQDDSQDDPFDVSSPGDYVGSTFGFTAPENTDPFVPADVAPQDDSYLPESDRTEAGPPLDAVPDDFDSAWSPSFRQDLTEVGRDEQPSSAADAIRAAVDLTELADSDAAGRGTADGQRETAVVNLDLLTARVAGHNLAVLRLANKLDGRDLWTAETLAPHVDRLIDLHQRRKDLVAFVELTGPSQRRAFDLIETTKPSVTLLAEKIVGARLRAMGDEFEGNSRQRQAELAALADFSRRLAEIAFDNPSSPDHR